jgi:hypothetical protein
MPYPVKGFTNELRCPLCKIFNLSLSIGVLPSSWRKANVTPVYKNYNREEKVREVRPQCRQDKFA